MPIVVVFRWTVFLLAAFYSLRMLIFGGWEAYGGPLRFLTIWALLLSFFCASRMMAFLQGRSARRWDGLVGATSVLNAMVVILYWRLYLADPYSVTQGGQGGAWWLEYYLHGLGPLLQWIDATFVHRSFRRLGASALWLTGLIGGYVLWIEGPVQWWNATPRGTVTSGLPYPFLNNLPWDGRQGFYLTNFAAAAVLLLVFAGIAWAVRRWVPAPAMPPAPRGSRDSAG